MMSEQRPIAAVAFDLDGTLVDSAPDISRASASLLAAAPELDVGPSSMLMVGDGPADLLATKAAGCPAALVAWGYGGHAVPVHLKVRHVQTPQQLLDELLQGREQDCNA